MYTTDTNYHRISMRPEFSNELIILNSPILSVFLKIPQCGERYKIMSQKGLRDCCEVFCVASSSRRGVHLNPDVRLITACLPPLKIKPILGGLTDLFKPVWATCY